MDAEALETFLAVHRERSFSNAARHLHRTQPAISRRISLLEAELGVPLFERAAQGPVLSQAGRALLPHAERALAVLADAKTAVTELKTAKAGEISLAVVGTLASAALSGAFKAFARHHPAVDLKLRTATSIEVSDLVRRGEAVLGLRYEVDRLADLDCELLAREPLAVICGNDHRLAGRSIGKLAALRHERWLAFPELPGRREISAAHISALFLAHGLDIDWAGVDSLTAQKRLVEAGFGLALMEKSSIVEELKTRSVSTITVKDLKATRRIMLVTRKGGYLSAATQALITALRKSHKD
ncbi:MAG: LysR family transcriptional regulator [Parvibaculaceae bacterium]